MTTATRIRVTPEGGPHRPEINLVGLAWEWHEVREAYVLRGADLPISVAYMGADPDGIFHGWTLLSSGCGVNLGGYVGPDGPMVDGAGYVKQQARRKLARAQVSLRTAVETCRAVGAEAT